MKLNIQNIGAIKEANIKIDGLTIITGLNNTGKSTIGKALFSICNATENIYNVIFLEKKDFISKRILNFYQRYFNVELYFLSVLSERSGNEDFPIIRLIFNAINGFSDAENEIVLKNILEDFFNSVSQVKTEDIILRLKDEIEKDKINSRIQRTFNANRFKSENLLVLRESINYISDNTNNNEFIRRRILNNLNTEFNNQYLKIESTKATITLSEKDKLFYNIILNENEIVNETPFIESTFQSVYLVDNPLIVDKWKYKKPRRRVVPLSRVAYPEYIYAKDMYDYSFSLVNHSDKLQNLVNEKSISSFEEIHNSEIYEKIMEDVSKLMSSDIFLEENDYVYSQNKIKLQNLATGLKMFIILRTLIEKGKTNEKSLLIFDEPESHLHPEWQNIFAETIVKLVKFNKCKILLVTHSPQFLLALETASMKLNVQKNTSFYNIKVQKNELEFKEINNHINEAYAEMVKPFLEMEALNTKYKYDNGGENEPKK